MSTAPDFLDGDSLAREAELDQDEPEQSRSDRIVRGGALILAGASAFAVYVLKQKISPPLVTAAFSSVSCVSLLCGAFYRGKNNQTLGQSLKDLFDQTVIKTPLVILSFAMAAGIYGHQFQAKSNHRQASAPIEVNPMTFFIDRGQTILLMDEVCKGLSGKAVDVSRYMPDYKTQRYFTVCPR